MAERGHSPKQVSLAKDLGRWRSTRMSNVSRHIAVARLLEITERTGPALYPLFVCVSVFLALTLFDIWSLLPFLLHVLLLAVLAGLSIYSLYWGFQKFYHHPSQSDAIMRVEVENTLSHGPINTTRDSLDARQNDPVAIHLWAKHQEQALTRISKLNWPSWRSRMPVFDRWASRIAITLVLVTGFAVAKDNLRLRFAAAFTPQVQGVEAAKKLEVELWIDPPAYTGMPPSGPPKTLVDKISMIPAGSEGLVQISHISTEEPEHKLRITLNGEHLPLEKLGQSNAQIRFILERETVLEVREGEQLVESWEFEVIQDEVPVIVFEEQPTQTSRWALNIPIEARDDYGIVELGFDMALVSEPDTWESFSLARPAGEPQEIHSRQYMDLTAHAFAGLPVKMRLWAEDAKEQTGRSSILEFELPSRVFHHQLARAVIQERKNLVSGHLPRAEVADQLQALAGRNSASEFGAAVPLALVIASERILAREHEIKAGFDDVLEILWETAIFIEEGQLSLAERSLRELQEQLRKALMEGESENVINELLDQIEEAMDRYLDEMQRQAQQQMEQMSPEDLRNLEQLDPALTIDRQQLQEMLDQAREMMENGMREQAQALMDQLQNMLENMQTAMQPSEPGPGEQAVNDLQKMIELQQNLLDRGFQMQNGQNPQQEQSGRGQSQPGENQGGSEQGQPGQGGAGQAAMEQDMLRRALGELMRRMAGMDLDLPQSLGEAELSMREARNHLQQQMPGMATGPQGEAIEQMRQAGQAMIEQLRQQMAQQPGQGMAPGRNEARGRDPLGRAQRNEGSPDNTDSMPDKVEDDLGRARDVLEELLNRSKDLNRPQLERDYIERLLDRF